MNNELPLETIRPIQRDSKGRFLKGNPGGPGGARPGSGRPPKPKDPSLLEELYSVLDRSALKALKVLHSALDSEDEKIRLKASELVLKKVLPDKSMLDLQAKTEAIDDILIDDSDMEFIRTLSYELTKRIQEGPK